MRVVNFRNLILRSVLVAFAPILVFSVLSAPAGRTAAQAGQEREGSSGDGIAVKSQLVISRCGSCHKPDDKNRLSRISYQRRTPEGWEFAIKRMVRLNGLKLAPDDARQIVKYLSKDHGLAPEESRTTFYEAERRVIEEKIPDENVRTACMLCHSLGRAASERRTREEWELLVNLHVGLFPLVTTQGFYRWDLPAGLPEPPGSDRRHPSDAAVEYLAKSYPLMTPEWQSWSASIRTPMLAGRWLITGSQIGRGRIFGELTVQPAAVEDEFITKIEIRSLRDGSSWVRTGRGVVYAGHSWRGRSTGEGNNGPENIREAMLVSRDWTKMGGRWFWGNYDEFGVDVTLLRVAGDPVVATVDRTAIKPSPDPQ